MKKIKSADNHIFYIVLSRVILPKNKETAGWDETTQEYTIKDLKTLYPEYIFICTKEKRTFELIPT